MADLTLLGPSNPLYPSLPDFAQPSTRSTTLLARISRTNINLPRSRSPPPNTFRSPPRQHHRRQRSSSAPPPLALPPPRPPPNTIPPSTAPLPRKSHTLPLPSRSPFLGRNPHTGTLLPPPPPLFRPTPFWRHQPRASSPAPAHSLVRRATFVAAGMALDRPCGDLSALGVEMRVGRRGVLVLLPT